MLEVDAASQVCVTHVPAVGMLKSPQLAVTSGGRVSDDPENGIRVLPIQTLAAYRRRSELGFN
jgi:hypothetical protein